MSRWRSVSALLACALIAGCSSLPGWMLLQRKSAITDYRHFDAAPIRRAAVPSVLPIEPDANPRLPAKINGQDFDTAMAASGTVALIVVRGGRVVLERYYDGYQRDSITTSFSAAKSVVSAMVGIAIGEGKIGNVDEPITRYIPELAQADARFVRVTIRNLLEMRSGIAFDEGYAYPWTDAARFYLGRDLMSLIGGLRIERPPDQAFNYISVNTQLLGLLVERATGQRLAAYAEEKIWQPMGAAFDATWSLDSADGGEAKAFCCLNARALDFARFGLIYLNQGRYNGRQIVPADWVRASTQARERLPADAGGRWNIEREGTPRAVFYAWQWRRVAQAAPETVGGIRPGADFFALGLHGQYIYVAPEQDTVIVRLGKDFGDIAWPPLLGRIARMNAAAPAASGDPSK
jgi:CubicO group peptidase (beta-lactamase class C family)